MLSKIARKIASVVLPLFTVATAIAADPQPPNPPVSNAGGLAVSLITSGYLFELSNTTATGVRAEFPIKPGPDAFVASASVQNRGRSAITFTFPDAATAATKWTFRVFDSDGNLVWTSTNDLVGAQVVTEQKLPRGQRWKRDVRVPLKIDGKPLADGIYTLEASVDADKQLGASAVFEVATKTTPPPPPPPEPTAGINGFVTRPAPAFDAPDAPKSVPAAGATIVVNEIVLNANPSNRPPFNWIGLADSAGKFKVVTPAGRFRVTAAISFDQPGVAGDIVAMPIPPRSVEVTVEAGKFSEVQIDLVAVTPPPPPPPPPPTEQGIKGKVIVSTNNTALISADAAVANAPVVVESIPSNTSNPATFRWTGKTNAEGRFTVQTPAGRYRVTASAPPSNAGTTIGQPPPVTIEVTVLEGKYSEAVLRLVRTSQPPPATR